MLSQESIERTIAQIREEIKSFQLDDKYLEKFTDTPYDREDLGYIRGGVGYDYTRFLPLLIKKLKLKNILELGNYAGASTVCMYAGMEGMSPPAALTTVDIVEDQRYCTDVMRTDSRVRFVIGDVCDLSVYGDHVPMDVDFVFEDTFHYYEHIRDIFEIYQHLLADSALFAIDDINDNDKRKLFDELPYKKWDLTDLCHDSGWGLIFFERKESRSKENRLQDAYRAAMNIWKRRFDKRATALDKIETRKLKNALRNFLYGHKKLHSLELSIKKKLGIIKKDARPLDEERFYSKGWGKEMENLRKNIYQERDTPEKG